VWCDPVHLCPRLLMNWPPLPHLSPIPPHSKFPTPPLLGFPNKPRASLRRHHDPGFQGPGQVGVDLTSASVLDHGSNTLSDLSPESAVGKVGRQPGNGWLLHIRDALLQASRQQSEHVILNCCVKLLCQIYIQILFLVFPIIALYICIFVAQLRALILGPSL
jgi:hypothetical protein